MKIWLTDLQQNYLLGTGNYWNEMKSYAYFEYRFSFDVTKLEDAINKIIDKHSILKSIVDSREALIVNENVEKFGINLFDFGDLNVDERIDIFLREGRNFKKGYLFDVNISGNTDPKLCLLFSILISDIETQKQIYSDLIYFYNNGKESICKKSCDEYRAINLKNIKESTQYSNSRKFWIDKLNILSNLPNIPNFECGTFAEGKILRKSAILRSEKLEILSDIGRKNSVSVPAIIYTVYAKSLSNCLNTKNFYLPMLFDKRKFYNMERDIVGNFSDLLLLEFDFEAKEDLFDKIRKAQTDFWNKLEYCHYSGVEVLRDINEKKGLKSLNSIPFLISINTDFKYDSAFASEYNNMLFSMIRRPNVLLDLQVNKNMHGVELVFYYQQSIFTDALVKSILNTMVSGIDAIANVDFGGISQ